MGLIKPSTASSEQAQGQDATPVTFAACLRSGYSSGHQDWLCINDSRFSNFDVCPSCFNTSIAPTLYSSLFKRANPRPPEISTCCDLADLWVRLAFTWIVSRSLQDVSILPAVTAIQVPEGPCPNTQNADESAGSKLLATRTWFSIVHPDTRAVLDTFTICSFCKSNVQTIFPSFRGAFVPTANHPCEATCDSLLTGPRGVKYLDCIFDNATSAATSGRADLRPLAELVARFGSLPECPKTNITKQNAYTMPTIPELPVCEECYEDAVKPKVQDGNALARSFSKSFMAAGFSCQLYSDRMRQIWVAACASGDQAYLAEKVRERRTEERDITMHLQQLKQRYQQCLVQADYNEKLMLTQTRQTLNTAQNRMIVGYGWHSPVADFTRSNITMEQASAQRIEAGKILDEMKMLENEWETYWE